MVGRRSRWVAALDALLEREPGSENDVLQELRQRDIRLADAVEEALQSHTGRLTGLIREFRDEVQAEADKARRLTIRVAFYGFVAAFIPAAVFFLASRDGSGPVDGSEEESSDVVVRPPEPTGGEPTLEITWIGREMREVASLSDYSTELFPGELRLAARDKVVLEAVIDDQPGCDVDLDPDHYRWGIESADADLPVRALGVVSEQDGAIAGCRISLRVLPSVDELIQLEVHFQYQVDGNLERSSPPLQIVLLPLEGDAQVFVVDVSSRMRGTALRFVQLGLAKSLEVVADGTVTGMWVAGLGDPGDCQLARVVGPAPFVSIGNELRDAVDDLAMTSADRVPLSAAIEDAFRALEDDPVFVKEGVNELAEITVFAGGQDTCVFDSDQTDQIVVEEVSSLTEAGVAIRMYFLGVDVDPTDEVWQRTTDFWKAAAAESGIELFVCTVASEELAGDSDEPIEVPEDFFLSLFCGPSRG